MIYVLIGMSLLFTGIGFLVTEANAKYLLSGYNTMREEDRAKVNLKAYIPYFRKFHIFLGVSFFILGTVLHYLISKNAAGIFFGVYPILAYMYFIWTSAKHSKGINTKWNMVGIYVLAGALVFVVGLFALGFKEDKLIINAEKIEFLGTYGEVLTPSEIRTIELVNQLPQITSKTNGFALGTIHKGYFQTREGEMIKLILNTDRKPYILVTKRNGQKIFFSSKERSNMEIYDELKKTFPAMRLSSGSRTPRRLLPSFVDVAASGEPGA